MLHIDENFISVFKMEMGECCWLTLCGILMVVKSFFFFLFEICVMISDLTLRSHRVGHIFDLE